MDKRWRNLGVLLVLVLVVLVAVFFVFPSFIFKPLTIDEGYEKIDALFVENDVNLDNMQSVTLVYVSSDLKNVVWLEKKENVANLKKDLVDFSQSINVSSNSKEVVDELNAVVDLFVGVIDYSYYYESVYNPIGQKIGPNGISCENISVAYDLNEAAYNTYAALEELSLKNEEFALNYNISSNLVFIDLGTESIYLDYINSFVDDFNKNCEADLSE